MLCKLIKTHLKFASQFQWSHGLVTYSLGGSSYSVSVIVVTWLPAEAMHGFGYNITTGPMNSFEIWSINSFTSRLKCKLTWIGVSCLPMALEVVFDDNIIIILSRAVH